ncbi:MAG: acyl-CoA dehydrogenase family protein [Solirubrobacterales bacterium]
MTTITDGATDLYDIPQEFKDLRDMIRDLAKNEVAPRAAETDEQARYDWDVRKLLADHDIFGLPFDTEYGGTGTGALMLAIAAEELAKACASTCLMLMIVDLGAMPIKLFGTDEQKQRILPKLASGEWSPAFGLSEADAGSDAGSMRTRAELDGDEWVINGQKNWTTNIGIADYYIVFAKTDTKAKGSKGVTAFIVEADRDGVDASAREHKLGIRGSTTGSPSFTDVRVGQENVIGEVGEGFKVALATLDRTRLGAAAQAIGIAQGATDYARSYAAEREQFGKPINAFQAIQFKLADMEMKTAAGRELLYQASARIEHGDREIGKYSSMAKVFCSDVAMEVTIEAIQVLGGYGYVKEYPVERMMRDAKITQIYEGTNEIQRLVIARTMR